jgi:hypothetical protein
MAWQKRNKYSAVRVTYDNHNFASKLEAAVYTILRANEDLEIQCQDHILLTNAEIKYIPDFKCTNKKTDEVFWAEAKGMVTPEFNIKKKLWKFYGPGPLHIYKGSHTRPFLSEIIEVKNG